MLGTAKSADMALDRRVVGRVGEDKVDPPCPNQPLDVRCGTIITAQKPMASELPKVTGS